MKLSDAKLKVLLQIVLERACLLEERAVFIGALLQPICHALEFYQIE
jgi:hypothetical protein